MSIQSVLSADGTKVQKTGQQRRTEAFEVARKFEEFFAREMVKSFRESSMVGEEGGLFGKGVGSDTYTDWFDEHMAHHVSDTGRIGIAETLMRDMERYNGLPTQQEAQAADKPKETLDAVA